MKEKIAMRCYISGKVQGVFYRASAREEAIKLGIKGWAKNLADGRVEVVACGTEDDLDLFFKWLKQGPKNAKVVAIAREEVSWDAHETFIVL